MNQSIWIQQSRAALGVMAPFEPAEVDVAVVGAGIFGVCCAYQLFKQSYKVALIEARQVGQGASGRNTGKLSSLHQLKYAQIQKKHGQKVAQAYARLNEEGIDLVEAISREFELPCDFERCPHYTYSIEDPKKIKAEVEAANKAGLKAKFVEAAGLGELPFPVKGAIKVENQARFNPYAFCAGTAAALQRQGMLVFQESRIAKVKAHPKGHRLISGKKTIIARQVVLATHLPILDRSGHFSILKPQQSHCIAAELEPGSALPQGMYISDADPIRSIQRLGDTLIIAGESSHLDGKSQEHYQKLEAFAKAHWPVRQITACWSAHDYMSPDLLPFIGHLHRASDTLFTATGFGKWGLAASAGASAIIRDLIKGKATPNPFDARRWNWSELKGFVKLQAHAGKHLIGRRITERASKLPEAASLTPGAGGLCSHGGKAVAAYKKKDGELILLKPTCQHLGCRVNWNQADQTWDCPCHGSRYQKDGSVMEGPTMKGLEKNS